MKKYLLLLSFIVSLAVSCSTNDINSRKYVEHTLNAVNKPLNNEHVYIDSNYLDAIKSFSVSYQDMLDIKANNIYSPLSIATCFSMAYEGADTDTKIQLQKLLKYKDGLSYKEMTKEMLENTSKDLKEDGKIDVSQSFFIDSKYKDSIEQTYLDTLTDYYYAEAYQGDLSSDIMHELLATWINNKTNNFLNVKKEDFSDYDGIMWLVNTVYAKARWIEEFNPNLDVKDNFYNLDKSTSRRTYMRQTQDNRALVGEDYVITYLPLNMGLKFVMLLPTGKDSSIIFDSSTLKALLDFNSHLNEYKIYEISYKMPYFKMQKDYDLKEMFVNAGYQIPFDKDKADFSNISKLAKLNQIHIGKATHVAGIDVNHLGVEAAAYTVIDIEATSAMPEEHEKLEFTLNHPFLYSIIDRNGLPLFIGNVSTFSN